MTPPPHSPWIYLEVAAALVSVAAWIAIPALWLTALPMTRAAKVTTTLVCVSAALSTVLPLFGAASAPILAVNHLLGGCAFLAFVVTVGVVFRQVAVRRRAAAAGPVSPPGDSVVT